MPIFSQEISDEVHAMVPVYGPPRGSQPDIKFSNLVYPKAEQVKPY